MIENIPSITLNTGHTMPMLGLGVYKATGANEVENAIAYALKAGYRLIDTASAYKNEDGVGRAVKTSSIPRKELFITTKVWNNAQRVGDIEGAFNRSLERLHTDYVDLYLIHWPVPGCYKETWSELEKLYHAGRARSIGVSNFDPMQLEELAAVSDLVPSVNQIEFHPLCYQAETLSYCREKGIAVQAYAPLARGAYLTNEVLVNMANKYNRTPAQIGLRWIIQKGVAVIPKSTQEERIINNGQLFDFTLTDLDMQMIDALNQDFRTASIPEDLR